jgi:site-specific DNA-cytosine methylase
MVEAQQHIYYNPQVAGSLTARDEKGPREDISEPNMVTYVSKMAQTGSNGLGISGEDIDGEETAHTLDSSGPEAVIRLKRATSFSQNQRGEVREADVAPALNQGGGKPGQGYPTVFKAAVEIASTLQTKRRDSPDDIDRYLYNDEEDIAVRKLTPLECERLQGFPDGWTDIPKNSDTQRYKQLGNAVTVNTVEWILKNIAATYPDLYIHPKVDR